MYYVVYIILLFYTNSTHGRKNELCALAPDLTALCDKVLTKSYGLPQHLSDPRCPL